MTYQELLNGIARYGSTKRDVCLRWLGVEPDMIQKSVIIAPCWEPDTLPAIGTAELLSSPSSDSVKVWNISNPREADITYIKTGIGAPVLMDAVLSLGVTRCKRALFIGSAGALDAQFEIGDIVIPEYSICGDGASRYLCAQLCDDPFGTRAEPNQELRTVLYGAAEKLCGEYHISCRTGYAVSIDTIFAQYAHLETFMTMGCNVIEMETAAAFRAAQLAGLSMAAAFVISDNTLVNKSLVSGRTEQERIRRRFVRGEVLPLILRQSLLA